MKYRRVYKRLLAIGAAAGVLGIALIAAPFATPGRAADDISQTRTASGFERVRLEGAFKARITAGASGTKVVVSGDPDLVSQVTTTVTDGTLVVGMKSGINSLRGTPRLSIELPVLRAFSNEGAASTKITGLTGGDVSIDIAGAGSIDVSGRAARETVSLNGTGKIDTTGVDAHDVTVSNNGVGSIHVRASGQLAMTVNGVGEIRYTGNPTHVESTVNGIGRIGRL